ncbi:MAG: hypothetical protein A2233_00465 [Candidatus Kerfeldbacteria bacterium RIFOXYA2_FULL_38_24]|nr:MAG: hypothetical protein A2233_00465 [Candidatus Kerfeldbacteria bacterium RIFOXYA2_FULL_38_24]
MLASILIVLINRVASLFNLSIADILMGFWNGRREVCSHQLKLSCPVIIEIDNIIFALIMAGIFILSFFAALIQGLLFWRKNKKL